MGIHEHEEIRNAYATLLGCADAAYGNTERRLAEVRRSDGAEAASTRALEFQLLHTTELIDLLESAVAQAIHSLTAARDHPVGQS
jgi:hypothetical protein